MAEVFGNSYRDPTTTLDGAIDNSQLTLDVIDDSELPAGGTFRLLIWDGTDDTTKEVVTCSGSASNTVTITDRGSDGTSAQAHGDGDDVELVVTAEQLEQYIREQIAALTLFTFLTAR